MKRIISGIFLLVLLSACSAPDHVRKKNYKRTHDKKYLPVLNPKPKYFMTISGKIDPRLYSNNVKSYFEVMYYTMNTDCKITTNWLEGIDNVQYKTVRYLINFKHNQYKIRIPIDKYTGGFCHWAIRQVDFNDGRYPQPESIADFTPCGKEFLCDDQNTPDKNFKTHIKSDVYCRLSSQNRWSCKYNSKSEFFGYIPRDRHYYFVLNYLLGREEKKHVASS